MLILASVAFGASSCKGIFDNDKNEKLSVSAFMGDTSDEYTGVIFPDGEQVSIFGLRHNHTEQIVINNAVFKVSDNRWTSTAKWPDNTSSLDVIGIYPALTSKVENASACPLAISGNMDRDQIMWAVRKNVTSSDDALLKFTRIVSKVEIEVDCTDASGKPQTVSAVEIHSAGSGMADLLTGKVTTTSSATATWVAKTVLSGRLYESVILPQTILAGSDFITIKAGGDTYTYRPTQNIVVAPDVRVALIITIAGGNVELSGISSSAWGDYESTAAPSEVNATINSLAELATVPANITKLTVTSNSPTVLTEIVHRLGRAEKAKGFPDLRDLVFSTADVIPDNLFFENEMPAEGEFTNTLWLKSFEGPNVTSIGDEAFKQADNLTRCIVPKVESIGREAFYWSGVTTLSLPVVKTVGKYAFARSDIASISLPEMKIIPGVAFYMCNSLSTVYAPKAIVIEEGAFNEADGLKEIYFPNVRTVEAHAFRDCANLVKADLPLMDSIGASAFCDDYQLSQINFPLLKTAMDGCLTRTGISVLMLPSLTTIYNHGLADMRELTYADLPELKRLCLNSFGDCKALRELRLGYSEYITVDNPDIFRNIDTANCDLYLNGKEYERAKSGTTWSGYTWKSIKKYPN